MPRHDSETTALLSMIKEDVKELKRTGGRMERSVWRAYSELCQEVGLTATDHSDPTNASHFKGGPHGHVDRVNHKGKLQHVSFGSGDHIPLKPASDGGKPSSGGPSGRSLASTGHSTTHTHSQTLSGREVQNGTSYLTKNMMVQNQPSQAWAKVHTPSGQVASFGVVPTLQTVGKFIPAPVVSVGTQALRATGIAGRALDVYNVGKAYQTDGGIGAARELGGMVPLATFSAIGFAVGGPPGALVGAIVGAALACTSYGDRMTQFGREWGGKAYEAVSGYFRGDGWGARMCNSISSLASKALGSVKGWFRGLLASTGLSSSYAGVCGSRGEGTFNNFGAGPGGVAVPVGQLKAFRTAPDLTLAHADGRSTLDVLLQTQWAVECDQLPWKSLPLSPLSEEDIGHAIWMELARGIFVDDAYPFFSLHFNDQAQLYPVLHPLYTGTIVGHVIATLDFFLKGFLNGGVYPPEFLACWATTHHGNTDRAFLSRYRLDMRDLVRAEDRKEYMSLREEMSLCGVSHLARGTEADDPDNSSGPQRSRFQTAFRIIGDLDKVERQGARMLGYSSFHVEYDIITTPEYQRSLNEHQAQHGSYPDDYKRLLAVYESAKRRVRTMMPRVPMFQPYFAALELITYASSILCSMKASAFLPELLRPDTSVVKDCLTPPLYPPLPVRYFRAHEMRISMQDVVNQLRRTEGLPSIPLKDPLDMVPSALDKAMAQCVLSYTKLPENCLRSLEPALIAAIRATGILPSDVESDTLHLSTAVRIVATTLTRIIIDWPLIIFPNEINGITTLMVGMSRLQTGGLLEDEEDDAREATMRRMIPQLVTPEDTLRILAPLMEQMAEEDNFEARLALVQSTLPGLWVTEILEAEMEHGIRQLEESCQAARREYARQAEEAIRQQLHELFQLRQRQEADLTRQRDDVLRHIAQQAAEQLVEIGNQCAQALTKIDDQVANVPYGYSINSHAVQEARRDIENQRNAITADIQQQRMLQEVAVRTEYQDKMDRLRAEFQRLERETREDVNSQHGNLLRSLNEKETLDRERLQPENLQKRLIEKYATVVETFLQRIGAQWERLSLLACEVVDDVINGSVQEARLSTADVMFLQDEGNDVAIVGGCGISLQDLEDAPLSRVQFDHVEALSTRLDDAPMHSILHHDGITGMRMVASTSLHLSRADALAWAHSDERGDILFVDSEAAAVKPDRVVLEGEEEDSFVSWDPSPMASHTSPTAIIYEMVTSCDDLPPSESQVLIDMLQKRLGLGMNSLALEARQVLAGSEHLLTPLHGAAAQGSVVGCQALLSLGVPVDPMTVDGSTPLLLACTLEDDKKAQSVAQILLAKGASPNTRNPNGMSCLYLATQNRLDGVCRLLVQASANVNIAPPDSLMTPLHCAVVNGMHQTVAALAQAGADVHAARRSDDRTPLLLAASSCQVPCMEAILTIAPTSYMQRVTASQSNVLHEITSSSAPQGEILRAVELVLNVSARHPPDQAAKLLGERNSQDQTPAVLAAMRGLGDVVGRFFSVRADYKALTYAARLRLASAVEAAGSSCSHHSDLVTAMVQAGVCTHLLSMRDLRSIKPDDALVLAKGKQAMLLNRLHALGSLPQREIASLAAAANDVELLRSSFPSRSTLNRPLCIALRGSSIDCAKLIGSRLPPTTALDRVAEAAIASRNVECWQLACHWIDPQALIGNQTPAQCAIEHGDIPMFVATMNSGCSPVKRGDQAISLLQAAAASDNLDLVGVVWSARPSQIVDNPSHTSQSFGSILGEATKTAIQCGSRTVLPLLMHLFKKHATLEDRKDLLRECIDFLPAEGVVQFIKQVKVDLDDVMVQRALKQRDLMFIKSLLESGYASDKITLAVSHYAQDHPVYQTLLPNPPVGPRRALLALRTLKSRPAIRSAIKTLGGSAIGASGQPFLHYLVQENRIDLVDLLPRSTNLCATDNQGKNFWFLLMLKSVSAVKRWVDAIQGTIRSPHDLAQSIMHSPSQEGTVLHIAGSVVVEELKPLLQILAMQPTVVVQGTGPFLGGTIVHVAAATLSSDELIQFLSLIQLSSSALGELLNVRDIRGWTALHHLCARGMQADIRSVQALLQAGASVSAINSSGDSAVHLAIVSDNEPLAMYLLGRFGKCGETREIVSLRNASGRSIAMEAAKRGHLSVLRAVQANFTGTEWLSFDNAGYSALHLAAEENQIDVVRFLLEEVKMDASIGSPGRRPWGLRTDEERHDNLHLPSLTAGSTAAHVAARAGAISVFRYLAERSIPVHVEDSEGKSPVDLLFSAGRHDAMSLAQEFSDGTPWIGAAALAGAATANEAPLVWSVLSTGCDPDETVPESHGATPLMLAAQENAAAGVGALLHAGASIRASNDVGANAMHLAAASDATSALRVLLAESDCQEAMNSRTGQELSRRTPLSLAIHTDSMAAAILLVARGAQVTIPNAQGQTPLQELARQVLLQQQLPTPEVAALITALEEAGDSWLQTPAAQVEGFTWDRVRTLGAPLAKKIMRTRNSPYHSVKPIRSMALTLASFCVPIKKDAGTGTGSTKPPSRPKANLVAAPVDFSPAFDDLLFYMDDLFNRSSDAVALRNSSCHQAWRLLCSSLSRTVGGRGILRLHAKLAPGATCADLLTLGKLLLDWSSLPGRRDAFRMEAAFSDTPGKVDIKSVIDGVEQGYLKALYHQFPDKPLPETMDAFSSPDLAHGLTPAELKRVHQRYQQCCTHEEGLARRGNPLSQMQKAGKQLQSCGGFPTTETEWQAATLLLAGIRLTIQSQFRVRPYTTQMFAILAMLEPNGMAGKLAQIRTGEGKSITSAMMVAYLGMAGRTVDVITSSQYLAIRDAEHFSSFFGRLGLSVSHICVRVPTPLMFSASIVYGTNTDFEFSIMRRMLEWPGAAVRSDGSPRPTDAVIVDEVDNLLLDTAMSPARLAVSADSHTSWLYGHILQCAQSSFGEDPAELVSLLRGILTSAAADEDQRDQVNTLDDSQLHQWVISARASLTKQRNVHYVVKDGQVVIVDYENTGQLMHGSRWSAGVHEFVEVREGIEPESQSLTAASMSHPSFFSLYTSLVGVTGTMGSSEEREEVSAVYHVSNFDVPTHRPRRLTVEEHVMLSGDKTEYDQALLQRVKKVVDLGRPVLLICLSLEQSNTVASLLTKSGFHTQLLNKVQAEDEELIIMRAGFPGMVTVATNAAGRGTDVRLTPEAAAAGGLHVMILFFPANTRVEEQGFGRAGRQGQLGSAQLFLHLDSDPLVQQLLRHFPVPPSLLGVEGLYALRQASIAATSNQRREMASKERIRFGFLMKVNEYLHDIRVQMQDGKSVIEPNGRDAPRLRAALARTAAGDHSRRTGEAIHRLVKGAWASFFTRMCEHSDPTEALFHSWLSDWIPFSIHKMAPPSMPEGQVNSSGTVSRKPTPGGNELPKSPVPLKSRVRLRAPEPSSASPPIPRTSMKQAMESSEPVPTRPVSVLDRLASFERLSTTPQSDPKPKMTRRRPFEQKAPVAPGNESTSPSVSTSPKRSSSEFVSIADRIKRFSVDDSPPVRNFTIRPRTNASK